MNVSKTKFMVFHTHNRSVSYPDLQINGNKIERVTEFNFLGLVLQSNLSWNKHINHISLKISKAIGIIYCALSKKKTINFTRSCAFTQKSKFYALKMSKKQNLTHPKAVKLATLYYISIINIG